MGVVWLCDNLEVEAREKSLLQTPIQWDESQDHAR